MFIWCWNMRFSFCISAKIVTLKSPFKLKKGIEKKNKKKTPLWILYVWKVELKELMWNDKDLRLYLAQPLFTCSILIIETVQNIFKVNYKDTRNMSMIFWRLFCLMCFEQISHTILQSLLLIMDIYLGLWVKHFYSTAGYIAFLNWK